jgi:osmotically-inducible protein OsmY
MKSDEEIKRDVEAELKWDPDLDATDIAASVKGGVVTLTGFVRSYTQKWQAEADAKRVSGVVGIANDIEVRLPAGAERPDPEIARDAVTALKNELPYSSENIRVVVKSGWITLEGTAEWNYQRVRAEEAVRRVSDCVAGQAIFHGDLVRAIALRIVRSWRRQAMMATFLGLPRLTRRW